MAKSPGDNTSKIPVLHSTQLKSRISKPLSSLSNRVRAHFDASRQRTSTSSVFFGLLNATTGGSLKNVTIAPKPITSSSFPSSQRKNDDLSSTTTTSGNSGGGGGGSDGGNRDDDFKTRLSRPTNIFTSGRFFPAADTTTTEIVNGSHIGKRVRLTSGKKGVLRFVGTTNFGEGVWCGVELDAADGTTDGTVNDVRYFNCPPGRGVFALVSKVRAIKTTPSKEEIREYLSDVSDSGPHSLLGITGEIDSSSSLHAAADDDNSVDNPTDGERTYFRAGKEAATYGRFSATPTPNSSNGSFVASYEWKCNSQYSSSPGSLVLSQRGLSAILDAPSVQISKHSSFEYDESLGILTPDQMGELATYSNDVTILGGEEFRSSPSSSKNVDAPPANTASGLPDALERLLSETDTCMMSVSSTSDQLECKEGFPSTPSLEELPFDQLDDLSTTLIADKCNDESFTIVRSAPPPRTSCVNSVTSIGSWDNGYQGDGECSRPTSRGAVDASPSHRTSKTAATNPSDAPTDSDFYTESDYDEVTTSKCARGDRKARVIDGKLFGSPGNTKLSTTSQSCNAQIFAEETNSATSTTTHERTNVPDEMDSSGIYSDLEKRLEEKKVQQTDGTIGWTPEESYSDTSSKSISSQKFIRAGDEETKNDDDDPTHNDADDKHTEIAAPINVETEKTTVNVATQQTENALKRPAKCKDQSNKYGESPIATKPKMPRRNNVSSKVKTMIIASSKCCEDENQENHQPASTATAPLACRTKVGGTKKTKLAGRWDTVMLKIEKGRNDGKTKTDRLKEVKSKVACGTTLRMAPSKLHKDVKVFSPNANAMNKATTTTTTTGKQMNGTLSDSTRSLKDNAAYRIAKSRKARMRAETESPVQSVTVSCSKSVGSRTSSRNSSITDISDSHIDISQHSLPAVVISTDYAKEKKSSSLLCSPVSDSAAPIISLHSNHAAAKVTKMSPLSLPKTKSDSKQIGSVNSLIEDSSTNASATTVKINRKTAHRRVLPKVSTKVPSRTQTKTATTNKNNPLKPLSLDEHGGASSTSMKSKTRQLNQISKINPLLARLKYATDGMEAFIILFQSLTSDTDVFALDRIKRELSKSKKDWLDMKMKLEEANVSYRRLKEEIESGRLIHERKLEELRDIHTAQLNRLNENQKQELEEHLSNHEMELEKLKIEQKTKEDALQSKYEENLRLIQKQAEIKLESILEGTKTQVELLKIENETWKDKLIKESKKKLQNVEAKVKSKIDHMETNYTSRLEEVEQEARKREESFIKSSARSRNTSQREDEFNNSKPTSNLDNIELQTGTYTTDVRNVDDEICSLRTVLDLKHGEIQELRKQNEKFKKAAQDLPFVEQKLDLAQARIEDLSAQLQAKVENEKKLMEENRRLLETVHHVNEKKKRLTFQNEELWWKLKNSTQVAKTLAIYNSSGNTDERRTKNVLAHSTPFHHKGPSEKCLKRSRTEHDIKLIESSANENDVSSKVLGVVEKNDSVSWVLEIDESPMAVASRMLRRANSLKGISSKKRSKAQHLQQSLSVPSRNKNGSGMTRIVSNESNSEASSSSNREKAEIEIDVENSKLKNADNITGKLENESAIADVATFFDFLHDSDSEEMDLEAGENGVEGDCRTTFYEEPGSPFSNTTSSDSSLELEGYDIADLKAYSRTVWNTSEGKKIHDKTLCRVGSDSEDSESMADELQRVCIQSKTSK